VAEFQSMSAMHELARRAHSADQKIQKIKESTEEAIGQGLQLVEVGGTAGLMGYANGRMAEAGSDHYAVAGVPVDLGVAAGMHLLAFAGGFGKYKEHGHNIGDGALAAYAYRVGNAMGVQAKIAAPQKAAGEFAAGKSVAGAGAWWQNQNSWVPIS
jgi:hypothetical protein